MAPSPPKTKSGDLTIWFLAFGYFAAYTPYSMLAKSLSKGLWEGMDGPFHGFAMLPPAVSASVVGMIIFLSVSRWWKYATRRKVFGFTIPSPTPWTFLSGLCTGAIIMTTTLAYTFTGVSIVFVMLLMRGGVLILAPIVDLLTGRKVRWFSLVGLLLSLSALVVAFSEKGGYEISLICAIDISIYLGSYFVRLRFMTRLAKSDDPNANKRFFVEEQLVATPSALLTLVILALALEGELGDHIRYGFTGFWSGPIVFPTLIVGFLSQCTGIFGGLILLQPSENTFCVPVNRSSSILAGVMASIGLAVLFQQSMPSAFQLAGASLIIFAIVFLTIPPAMEKRKKRAEQAETETS